MGHTQCIILGPDNKFKVVIYLYIEVLSYQFMSMHGPADRRIVFSSVLSLMWSCCVALCCNVLCCYVAVLLVFVVVVVVSRTVFM